MEQDALPDGVHSQIVTIGSELCLQMQPNDGEPIAGYVKASNSSESYYVDWMKEDTGSGSTLGRKEPCSVRFTVCPPTRFQEQLALLEAEATLAFHPNAYTQKQMDNFRFEAGRGAQDFERLKGTRVFYGQQVSLYQYHVERTLCISSLPVEADDSRGLTDGDILTQTMVTATTEPASGMVVRIMPGNQIRSEGDPVRWGDIIVLKHAKHEQYLHVNPWDETASKSVQSGPHVVASVPVLASERQRSRMQLVPVASDAFSYMANKEQHQKTVMGGAYVCLQHRGSGTFLAVDSPRHMNLPDKQISLEEPEQYSGVEPMADNWCIDDIDVEWSGRKIEKHRAHSLRHWVTGLFLECNDDGSLQMASACSRSSAHWEIVPLDQREKNIEYEDEPFFIMNAAHDKVLRRGGDGELTTVPWQACTEQDGFIATHVPISCIKKLQLSAALTGVYMSFRIDLEEFYLQHGKQVDKKHDLIMQMDPDTWETQLKSEKFVTEFATIAQTNGRKLLSQLLPVMRGLFPSTINENLGPADLVDYSSSSMDTDFAQSLSGSRVVPELIELLKTYLFRFPCVLFGGPRCYCGQDIFLAVRCAFRLIGILSTVSRFSGLHVYENLTWITYQVGIGRFKAAEALSSALFSWPSLTQNVCDDHPEFLSQMLKHVLNKGWKQECNGDHAQCVSSVCTCQGQAVTKNQDALAKLVDFGQIVQIVQERISNLRSLSNSVGIPAMRAQWQNKLAPTDSAYYTARVIEMVTRVTFHNVAVSKSVKSHFPHTMLSKAMFDLSIHPYIRAKCVRLASVLYLHELTERDFAQPIRIPKIIQTKTEPSDSDWFRLSAEHVALRDSLFNYLEKVDTVVNPEQIWENRLFRTILDVVLQLFKSGDFHIGEHKIQKPTSGNTASLPDAELIERLVIQFGVTNDKGWCQQATTTPDPRVQSNENIIVFHIKLTIAEILCVILSAWQSMMVDEVVDSYAGDSLPKLVGGKSLTDGSSLTAIKFDNPIDNPIVDDSGESDSQGMLQSSRNSDQREVEKNKSGRSEDRILSRLSTSTKEMVKQLSTCTIFDGGKADRVVAACTLLTQCDYPKLQAKAFELIFDITMPSKRIMTIVHECDVIFEIEEAEMYYRLRQHIQILNDAQRASNHHNIVGAVDSILDALSALPSIKSLLFELRCHLVLIELLKSKFTIGVALKCKILSVLGLVCDGDPDAQRAVAEMCLEQVVLPAVDNPDTSKDALQCLRRMFTDNRGLCEAYSQQICFAIYGAAMGRLTAELLLDLVKFLPCLIMHSGGDLYPHPQAVIARLVCRLFTDHNFPSMKHRLFSSAMAEYLLGSITAVEIPAIVAVLSHTLRLLRIASTGNLDTVEMMCAKLAPLSYCLSILQIDKLSAVDNEVLLNFRCETYGFLHHVHFDTTSLQIISIVQTRGNGIWMSRSTRNKSLLDLAIGDILKLVDQFESHQDTKGTMCASIFDALLPAIFGLFHCTSLTGMLDEEYLAAQRSTAQLIKSLRKLIGLLQYDNFSEEKRIATAIMDCSESWLVGQVRRAEAGKLDGIPRRTAGLGSVASLPSASSRAGMRHHWNSHIKNLLVRLQHKERDHALDGGGIWGSFVPFGMHRLAELLWESADSLPVGDSILIATVGGQSSVQFLLPMLLNHANLFANAFMLDALDSLRMILYYTRAASVTATDKISRKFIDELYDSFTTLDHDDILDDVQQTLCHHGLLQVCLQIVLESADGHLKAAALRNVAATLATESEKIDAVLLEELNESEQEIFVSSYRAVLDKASEALKDVYVSAKRGLFSQAMHTSGIYEAAEFLRVIKVVCAGDAQDIQNYIREQPERDDHKDGITVLVEYLTALEQFFPDAIAHERPNDMDQQPNVNSRERDVAAFYHDIVISQTILTLGTIADITDGPNLKNQMMVAEGPLLEGINKLLDSIDLQQTPLFKFGEVQPFDYRITRQNEQILVLDKLIFLLQALLEGPPSGVVHKRMVQCISWHAYAGHLHDMYQVLRSIGKIRSARRFNDRAVQMWAVVQQLLETSALGEDVDVRRELHPVLLHTDMVNYYNSCVCGVEVFMPTSDGYDAILEKVYFPKPILHVVSHRQLKKNMGEQILNKCPLDDDETKLREFQELCLEHAVDVSSTELAFFWGKGLSSKIKTVLAQLDEKKGKILQVFTLGLNVMTLTLYKRGSCPLCPASYCEADEVCSSFVVMAMIGPMHVIVCLLSLMSWFSLRAPVLLHRIDRRQKTRNELEEEETDHHEQTLTNQVAGDATDALRSLQELELLTAVGKLVSASISGIGVMLNVGFGGVIPISQYFQLKFEPEFLGEVLALSTSLSGILISPLFFSYHMFKIVYNSDLEIILGSFTQNFSRLTTMIAFMVLAMLLFAISAFLEFENKDSGIGSVNGECDTLLQCFISYIYRGLSMSTLDSYLPKPQFPKRLDQMLKMESVRLLWEVLFTFITVSALGAIITGIICDSFGELRDKKDTAQSYRKQTNFVTGIPFSEIAEARQPNPLNYFYFFLYLQQKAYRIEAQDLDDTLLHESDMDDWELDRMTATEEVVMDKIEMGDVSWMPRGGNIYKQHMKTTSQFLAGLEVDVSELREEFRSELSKMKNEFRSEWSELQDMLQSLLSEKHAKK